MRGPGSDPEPKTFGAENSGVRACWRASAPLAGSTLLQASWHALATSHSIMLPHTPGAPNASATRTVPSRRTKYLVLAASMLALGAGAMFALSWYKRKECCPELSLMHDAPIPDTPFMCSEQQSAPKLHVRPYRADNESLAAVGAAECRLGWALLTRLAKQNPNQNVVISPHAIALALGMLATASEGETRGEILAALQFSVGAKAHLETANLALAMHDIEHDARCIGFRSFRLRGEPEQLDQLIPEYSSGTAAWVPARSPMRPRFSSIAASNYRASFFTAESQWRSRELVTSMNAWAKQASQGRFNEFVRSEEVNDAEGIVMGAMAHLDALWPVPGEPTRANFNNHDATIRPAPFGEYERIAFNESESGNYQVITHQAGVYPVFVQFWVPKMRRGSSGGRFDFPSPCTSALKPSTNALTRVPMFSVQTRVELREALQAVGISRVFDPAKAELSCAGECRVWLVEHVLRRADYVARIWHAARISHDERGINQARTDSRIWALKPESPPRSPVTLDSPFFVLVSAVNTVFYMGWIATAS
jgi:serine protease inhibitor